MNIESQINEYISTQQEEKCKDMEILHKRILEINPTCKLWFLDGRNSENKVVSNPNIGYGTQTIRYAGGKNKEFLPHRTQRQHDRDFSLHSWNRG